MCVCVRVCVCLQCHLAHLEPNPVQFGPARERVQHERCITQFGAIQLVMAKQIAWHSQARRGLKCQWKNPAAATFTV